MLLKNFQLNLNLSFYKNKLTSKMLFSPDYFNNRIRTIIINDQIFKGNLLKEQHKIINLYVYIYWEEKH